MVDVACGDYHSCAVTNQKEVLLWGSNKDGQLGQDLESCPHSHKPLKLQFHEYMNSSTKERIISVKASTNYTVLVCESKNVSRIPLDFKFKSGC